MPYSLLIIKGNAPTDIRDRLEDILNGFPLEDSNQEEHGLNLSIVYTDQEDLITKIETAYQALETDSPVHDPSGIYFEPSPSMDQEEMLSAVQDIPDTISMPMESAELAHHLAELACQGVPMNLKSQPFGDTFLPPDIDTYELPGEPPPAPVTPGPPRTVMSQPSSQDKTGVALKSYLEGNSDVLKSFFDLQEKSLAKVAETSDNASYLRLLGKMMGDNQQLIREYMAAQTSVMTSLFRHDGERPCFDMTAPTPGDGMSPPSLSIEPQNRAENTAPALTVNDIETWVINEIAEVTGYPVDTITRDANFEADIGLDSITMIQILMKLVKIYPDLEQLGDNLRHVKKLTDLSDLIIAMQGNAAGDPVAPASADEPENNVSSIIEFQQSIIGENTHDNEIQRFVFTEKPATDTPLSNEDLKLPDTIILIGSKSALFDHVQQELGHIHIQVIPMQYDHGQWELGETGNKTTIRFDDLAGLTGFFAPHCPGNTVPATVFVADDDHNAFESGNFRDWAEQIELAATGVFLVAKALTAERAERNLTGDLFAVLTRRNRDNPAWQAAIGAGKAVNKEWPGVNVRFAEIRGALDQIPVTTILARLLGPWDEYPLIIDAHETRALEFTAQPFSTVYSPTGFSLDADANILITGGGSGITAEMGVILAENCHCTIIGVGRTPWPDKNAYMNVPDDAILKKRIFEDLKRNTPGNDSTLPVNAKEVKKIFNTIKRQQAMLETQKRIEACGGTFKYYQADVTSESDITETIRRIHQEIGPVNGLIHGAGLTNDYLVSGKSIRTFRQVVYTKAHSVFHLYHLLKNDPLEFVSLISSISAVFGRASQTDYVAANEVLNSAASFWNRRAAYPVKAVLWSLWTDTGLAGNSVITAANQFFNLTGITAELGRKLFLEELRSGDKAADNVIFSSPATLCHAKEADLELYSRLIEEGSKMAMSS